MGPRRAAPNKSKGGGWRHARQDSSCPLNPPTFRDLICEGAEATGSAVNLAVPPPLHHHPGVPRPRFRPITSTSSLCSDVDAQCAAPCTTTPTSPSTSSTTPTPWPTTPKPLVCASLPSPSSSCTLGPKLSLCTRFIQVVPARSTASRSIRLNIGISRLDLVRRSSFGVRIREGDRMFSFQIEARNARNPNPSEARAAGLTCYRHRRSSPRGSSTQSRQISGAPTPLPCG